MNLIINGEKQQFNLDTIADLIKHYQLTAELVVTEVDGLIVNQEERASTKLVEGMKIEIVQFVGGG